MNYGINTEDSSFIVTNEEKTGLNDEDNFFFALILLWKIFSLMSLSLRGLQSKSQCSVIFCLFAQVSLSACEPQPQISVETAQTIIIPTRDQNFREQDDILSGNEAMESEDASIQAPLDMTLRPMLDMTPQFPCPPQRACDDGDPCTYDDHCEATGQRCVGTVITCTSSSCIRRECNGTSACQESYTTQICDDGQACTHSDRCQDGLCIGTPISCSSTECIERSCNGTSTCFEQILVGQICEASTACSPLACNSSGVCTGTISQDGTPCGGLDSEYCCQGQCVDLSSDADHCGGCGMACDEGYSCNRYNVDGRTVGLCGCIGYNNCYGADSTCHKPNGESRNRCNCVRHTDCAPGQRCYYPSSWNYCAYP